MGCQKLRLVPGGARPAGDGAAGEERIGRIVALGRAISDPIRVRMLGMMAEGRGCCGTLPGRGVPAEADEEDLGICICEFEDHFGMGQSKVSYHVKELKEAGLVRERKRGRWSFYSLNDDSAWETLGGRLAQEALALALALARERGAERVYLLTETADGFFPRFGFRTVPRREAPEGVRVSVEFVSACPESARAMMIHLLGRSR